MLLTLHQLLHFLMILLAPEVSFVTLHMRWHKGCCSIPFKDFKLNPCFKTYCFANLAVLSFEIVF